MSISTNKSILITPGSFSSSNNAISQIDLKWVESGVGTFVFRPNVNDLRSTIYNWQQNSEPVILFGGMGTVNGVRKFAGPYQDYTGTFSGITSFPQIQFFPLSGTIYANTLTLSGIASFNQIYSAGLSTFGSINLLGPLYDQTFNSGSVNQVLTSTVNGVAWSTPSTYGNISGLGITNYVSKFSNSTSLTTSNIIDNGSLVTVGIGMSVNGFTTVAGSFVSTGNAGIGTSIYSNVRLVTRSADSTSATESFRTIDSTGTATFQVTGAGSVGIGSLSAIYRLNVFHNTTNTSVGAYQANLEVTQTLATARSILGGRFSVTGRINATSTNNIYGIYGLIGFSYASAGVTNSGEIAAGAFDARTSNANHSGTNAMQMAVFGMYNASASATGLGTIQNAYGGRFIADYGYPANFTIQNSFGVRVQSTNSTSYPQNSFGFYEDLASAANAKNFFLNPVGIGTSSPTQNLHVQGNARLTGGLYDSTNSPGSTNQILSSTGSGIAWTSFNSSGIFTGTVAPNQVAIGSTGNRLQGFSTFIFDSTGLSIGTSIPEQRLTVSGNVKATGTVTANQFISTTFTDPPLVVNSQSLVTNLNSEYWKDQAYPLSTIGDLLYSSDNSGTAARLAPNTTTVIKVLTQVGDGVEASAPSWQPLPSSGFLQYFFTGLAATNAPQNYQLANDLPVGLGTTSINFTSGEALIAQFITDPGVPNLEYLPAGNLAAYVWGLQTISTTLAAVPTVQLRVDFYETTSLGTSISKIVSSNDSTELVPTAERYTLIGITTGTYNLASRSSRIQARVYAVHGLTGIATVNVFYGNGYDSLVQIVAPGADVTNFVPYQGAVNNVDLGIKNLRAGAVGLYTGFSTVAPEQGQFIWNSTTQEVDLGLSDGYSVSVGFENALRVYNNTLNTIGVGSVVYVTGSAGNIPTVDLASAALFDSSTVVGVTNRLIAPASYGYIYTYGTIDYNTSSFVSGDNLFLSDTQAGILTSISPLAPSFSVLVGTVLNSGTSGSIVVLQNSINSLNESSRILFANSNKFPQGISTFVYSRGNVGIGTTAPTQNLHVQGNARLTGGLYDSTNSPGSLGQILSSTGSGIAWTSVNTTGILTANGGISNRVTKFLDEDTLGNSNITDTGTLITLGSGVTVSGILTSFGFFGPGTFITNLNASNLASGTVPSSVVSGSYSGITSVGNLTQLNVTGITTSNIFVGNGSNITNLNASNLTSGIVNTNRISGSYSGITSVGTLTQLNVAGITTSTSVRISNQLYDSNFSSGSANQILISTGNAIVWTSVNVTGILTANGGISNRVTKFLDEDTLGNSNITDTGTLITLGSGVTVSGILTSFGYYGPGTFITNLNASNLASGTVPSSVVSGSYSGITSVGNLTQLNVTGITTSNIFVGNGSNITNLNAVNLASGIVPSAVISGSYSGITSVGSLTQLNVSGITTSTSVRISNQLYDSNFSSGTQNQLLISTGVGISWTSTTATGIITGTGAATRVAYFADANTLTSNSNFIVSSSGFIGISTTIPRQRLEVSATARFSGNVLFYGSTANDSYGLFQVFDTTYQGTNNVLRFRQSDSTAGAVAFSFYDYLPNIFMVVAGSASPRVGIGTTGPLQTLHVGGNALISGITTSLGFSGFGTGLTNLNASNLVFGIVPSSVVSGAYSGITSVGSLTQLNVSGITTSVNLRLSGIFYDGSFSSGSSGQLLSSTGTGVAWTTASASGIFTGSGTINTVPKFASPNSLTNSNITDNGVAVTVGSQFFVNGVGSFTGDIYVNRMTVGLGSGQIITNTAFGNSALVANTTGNLIVAIGYQAGLANTNGSNLTAVGYRAMASNTTGSFNAAFGDSALAANTTGINNAAFGSGALAGVASNRENSGFGIGALGSLVFGDQNTGLGAFTFRYWLNSAGQTAVGYNALRGNVNTALNTGSGNVAVGFFAGAANTSGSQNTFVGNASGGSNTSGGFNVAVGSNSLTNNTTGDNNVVVGYSMTANTTGSDNTALGHIALDRNTTGSQNVALGREALRYNTVNSFQVAVGYQALMGNSDTTLNTGVGNLAVGYQAGTANTSGLQNTFIGNQAGTANTSGSNNTVVGYQSLFSNLTGTENAALGVLALNSSVTGQFNVAFGSRSLRYYGAPSGSVAIGYQALQGNSTVALNTGSFNVAIGLQAGLANTSGANNLFVGYQAGSANTSGSTNTYLGKFAGDSMLSGSNNTFVGSDTDGSVGANYQIAIGQGAIPTATNLGAWGGNSNSTRTDLGIGTFTPLSRLHVETLAAGNMGLYIAGSASQTADLVEINATTVGQNYFTVTGIGSVGIYTNTPSQALDINGGTRLRGRLFDSNNNSGTQNQLLISTGVGISWTSTTATGIVTGTGAATRVAYFADANTLTSNSDFIVSSFGFIGISTNIPRQKLDVFATARFSGNVLFYGSTSNDAIALTQTFDTIYQGTNNVLRFRQGGSVAGAVAFSFFDDLPAIFMVYNTINSPRVGIGTTGPLQTLHVGGNALISGITTALGFSGFGTGLTNLNASNLAFGTVPSAVVSGSYSGITSVGNLTQLNVTGITTSNIFVGNGSNITNLNAVNLASGIVPSAVVSGTYSGITSVGSLTQLNVTGITSLNSVRISNQLYDANFSSGTANQILISTGNAIVWTSVNVTGILTANGGISNRVSKFLDEDTLGNSNITDTGTLITLGSGVTVSGILTSFGFFGPGTNITNLNASNIASGTVPSAVVSGSYSGITSVGNLTQLNVTGITTSNIFVGNGSNITNLNAVNLASGIVPSAVISGSYSGITSVGSLTQLNVTGITTSNVFVGNGSNITNLNAVNLASGIVPSAVISGSYSGITSVGSLTQLNVTGITSSTSVRISNQLYDSNFSSGTANQILISTGNAIVWTSVNVTGILTATGGISNRVTKFLDEDTLGNSNIIDTGTLITLGSGVTVSGILTSFGFFGPGTNIANLNASNLASGTVPSAVISGSYSGITSVGSLTQLNVTGITSTVNLRLSGILFDNNFSSGTQNQVLISTGTGVAWTNSNSTGILTGSGTINVVPKFSGPNSLTTSNITDNGLAVTVASRLNVVGVGSFTNDLIVNQMTVGLGSQQLTSNVAIGFQAFQTASPSAGGNVAVGDRAMQTTSNAIFANVAVGQLALAVTQGSRNVALGAQALYSNTTGASNIAIGYQALFSNTTDLGNIAIGNRAMWLLTGGSGGNNIAIGGGANLTTAAEATFVGATAGNNYTTQGQHVAVGAYALVGVSTFTATGTQNTAVGYAVMTGITGGSSNVGLGHFALNALTSGNSNTGLGYLAASSNTTGGFNVAVGREALRYYSTVSNQVAVGYQALQGSATTTLNTGTQNTALGYQAGLANTSGSGNTFVGYFVGRANTTGEQNTFVGNAVGYLATTGSYNNVFGSSSLQANNTGNANQVFGYLALFVNTSGGNNHAFGNNSLERNTTASNNVAFGNQTLTRVVTNGNNVAVGFAAMRYTTAANQVAVGYQALQGSATTELNTGTQNTAFGYQAGIANTSGSSNVFVGFQAGVANTSGSDNTVLGNLALNSNTVGNSNVAVGSGALRYYPSSSGLVAIGANALRGNTTVNLNTGTDNVAIGQNALAANTSGSTNVAIGRSVALSNTSGSFFTAVGQFALVSNTTGNSNNAFGNGALYYNTTGGNNVAVGTNALLNYVTVSFQVAIGNDALRGSATTEFNTGTQNTAVGYQAGFANTSGANNTFVGYQVGLANTTGSDNTATGNLSLNSNLTGSNNTAHGSGALRYFTTASNNVAIGVNALRGNSSIGLSTGGNNVAVGTSALLANTTGNTNVVIGQSAAIANTTGSFNVVVGAFALSANTTGSSNIALGNQVLQSNTTGGSNVAVGGLQANTTGSQNVSVGGSTLSANTTGNNNTAIGNLALRYTSVSNLVAVGYQALQGSATTTLNTGTQNTAFGYQAGIANTSGSSNVFVGYQAGLANTSGNNNNFIGNIAGFNNLTGINNQALGSGALYSLRSGNNHVAIGNAALFSLTGSIDNIGIGFQAAYSVVSGDANIAIGRNALFWSTSASNNVAIGYQAMLNLNNPSNQTAIGYQALQGSATTSFNTGIQNTAIGYQAGIANSSGSSNVFIGFGAGLANTSGSENIALGVQALLANLTGTGNVALGQFTLAANTAGGNSTAVGQYALQNNTAGGNSAFGATALRANTTGTENTAIGYVAMVANTTGFQNSALGLRAMQNNTTGGGNVAMGRDALRYYQTSNNQTAVGTNALAGNSTVALNTGTQNTAFGANAGLANTSGSDNVLIGFQAGVANTTGSFNTFVGSSSGASNTSGDRNASLGHQALQSNTINGQNVAIGQAALRYFDQPNQTAVGWQALQGNSSVALNTGVQNVALGYQAGFANTSGSNNSYLGFRAGTANTSGNNNIFVGTNAGASIVSGSNNIIIGTFADGAIGSLYQIALGISVAPTGSNMGAWGRNSDSLRTDLGIGTYTPLSRLHVETLAAGNMGLYIAGSVSQTADLVEINATTVGQNYFTITGIGSVGIYTNTPSQALDINGGTRLRGRLFDVNNTAGTQNQLLISTGVGISWTSATATGIVTGTGTATQVAYWNSANQIAGNNNFVFNGVGSVGINTTSPEYALHVVGTLAATIKSFIIAHPTKPGRKLRYASLEGPENGVYLRGRTDETKIILPEYWRGLVDHDSITVSITPIGTFSKFCVEKIENYVIHVKNENMFNKKQEYFYVVFGERKDVDKLEVEI